MDFFDEQTVKVLKELGYSDAEIRELWQKNKVTWRRRGKSKALDADGYSIAVKHRSAWKFFNCDSFIRGWDKW